MFIYLTQPLKTMDISVIMMNQLKKKQLSEDQHINCSLSGRYVMYYNERRSGVEYPNFFSQYPYNELCEVEIYCESQITKHKKLFSFTQIRVSQITNFFFV